jgi:hypothetical protein
LLGHGRGCRRGRHGGNHPDHTHVVKPPLRRVVGTTSIPCGCRKPAVRSITNGFARCGTRIRAFQELAIPWFLLSLTRIHESILCQRLSTESGALHGGY